MTYSTVVMTGAESAHLAVASSRGNKRQFRDLRVNFLWSLRELLRHSARLLRITIATLACIAGTPAIAVIPESGLYWNARQYGNGYTVEVQGNVVVVIAYMYGTDGEPEFLLGAGTIGEGGFLEPSPYGPGLFPIHSISGPLNRFTDGLQFGDFTITPAGRPLHAPVGTFRLTFATHNTIVLEVTLTRAGQPPFYDYTAVSRMNYGYGGYGTGAITAANLCIHDYRGEWVYVDESNPALPAWRFNFTEVSVDAPANFRCPGPTGRVTFRDASRGAELRCVLNRPVEPPATIPRYDGCELVQGGETLFSTNSNDLGLERFVGFRGPLPLSNTGILRGPQRVLGKRMK